MSWNRLQYDQCAYRKDLSQSTSSLNYLLDTSKFYNCNDCQSGLGIIGGNNVSLTKSNMVDLESDLFNITRQFSTCPERKFLPTCPSCAQNGGMSCGSADCAQRENLKHVPECENNIVRYAPRIDHVGYSLNYKGGCPVRNVSSINGQPMVHPPQLNPLKWE